MFSSGRRALQTQLCEDISGARCPADPQEQVASTTARAQGRCSITKSHFGGHGSSHWVTPSPRVTHSILPTPTTETSTSPEHGSPEAPFSTAPGLAVASLCGPGPAPHPLWAPASSSVRDGLRRPSPADERQSDATARARPDHRFPRSPAPPPHSRGPRCPVGPCPAPLHPQNQVLEVFSTSSRPRPAEGPLGDPGPPVQGGPAQKSRAGTCPQESTLLLDRVPPSLTQRNPRDSGSLDTWTPVCCTLAMRPQQVSRLSNLFLSLNTKHQNANPRGYRKTA